MLADAVGVSLSKTVSRTPEKFKIKPFSELCDHKVYILYIQIGHK